MLKYLVLSLFLLSLSWQALAEEPTALPEYEDDDFEAGELNDTESDFVLGPRFSQINVYDSTYSFSLLPVNWHTARELCTSQNQVIASIRTAQETAALIAALYQQGLLYTESSFWIGGSELGHIGRWTWVNTGSPIFYSNWQVGAPVDYWNGHCMELLSNGNWNNNDCDLKRPVICQSLPSCSR